MLKFLSKKRRLQNGEEGDRICEYDDKGCEMLQSIWQQSIHPSEDEAVRLRGSVKPSLGKFQKRAIECMVSSRLEKLTPRCCQPEKLRN